VDGCRSGWIFVAARSGRLESVEHAETFGAGLTAYADAAVVAVDVPIGVPLSATRRADDQARRLPGRRGRADFPIPPLDVLRQPNYAQANRRTRALTGRGLSRQSFALASKILEIEPVARGDARVVEVHPEVSFWALGGSRTLAPKQSWHGVAERRRLLADTGLVIPDDVGPAGEMPHPTTCSMPPSPRGRPIASREVWRSRFPPLPN